MIKREIDFKTTEQLHSAEIKAALYAGGNLSKLVRNALTTYSEELPYETVKRELVLNVQEYKITVHNVPHFLIDGKINENLILSSTLERIMEQMIHEADKNILFININVDFEDLI